MRRVAPAVLLVSPLLLLGCGERTHSCCVTDDVGYRAEFGEGHDARQAELECQGTLEAGACPREGVVGQCVHQISGPDLEYVYRELYYEGFAGYTYEDPAELDALEKACVDGRGGTFLRAPPEGT